MNTQYSTYPEDLKDCLYYVEFKVGEVDNGWHKDKTYQERWTLFRRQWLDIEIAHPFMTNEVHPWNLGSGVVDDPKIVTMQTKEFLIFMVDSLNERARSAV